VAGGEVFTPAPGPERTENLTVVARDENDSAGKCCYTDDKDHDEGWNRFKGQAGVELIDGIADPYGDPDDQGPQ